MDTHHLYAEKSATQFTLILMEMRLITAHLLSLGKYKGHKKKKVHCNHCLFSK